MAPPPPITQPALPPMREVTEDTPPDMLAGAMDLRVLLPDGHAVKMNVDRSTPMMDLLVHVTTANKMSPGSHVIQAVGEKGNILPYKPSTPIGALDTWTIQIVSKSKASTAVQKKVAPKPSNQPFEQTFRLQVNLPRNQLFVTRVSPRTPLLEVLRHVCTEKGLDPEKYDLRNPGNPNEVLRLTCSLLDYKLQEVTVALRGTTVPHNHHSHHRMHATSATDIISLQHHQHLSEIGDKRRKSSGSTNNTSNSGGVFGFIFKRGSRSSVCEGSVSSDSLGGQSISPARSDESLGPARSATPPLSQANSRGISGSSDQLRNQINSQMSRRQENISHPVCVSDKSLKQNMSNEMQPPPPPMRHKKRKAPKPPLQNAGLVSENKNSGFITPAPPSAPAPVPVTRRKSVPADDDEFEEEDIHGNVGNMCKSKSSSGGTSTGGTLISHSRNSSDSSGYHEASVLSESPESGLGGSGAPDTLPRRKQQKQLQHQASEPNPSSHIPPFSRSMGNLASVVHPSSAPKTISSSSYSSLCASTSSLQNHKKKKAPAPPPPPPTSTSAPCGKFEENEVGLSAETSSKNLTGQITNSLDRTPPILNGIDEDSVSFERGTNSQAKIARNREGEIVKANTLPVQAKDRQEPTSETKVLDSQVSERISIDTSSEKSSTISSSSSNPVSSASKSASVNKSGPAVAPKPQAKAAITQRPLLQNSQGSPDPIPIPKPRSKSSMPKKHATPSPAPRTKPSVSKESKLELEKVNEVHKAVEVVAKKASSISGSLALSMVPTLENKDVTKECIDEVTNLDTKNEDNLIEDDVDLALFDGGKSDSVKKDTGLNEEEKSSDEEFDEDVIRRILDHQQKSFADMLDGKVEEVISDDVDGEVVSNGKDKNVEAFFLKDTKRTTSSPMSGGKHTSICSAGLGVSVAGAETVTDNPNVNVTKLNNTIRQVESAINFTNVGEKLSDAVDVSRFSSNSLCSEVDMPFASRGGTARINRWQNMESLPQSSSASSMEKHGEEVVDLKALEKEESLSANWVVGSESDDGQEVSDAGSNADSMTADSLDGDNVKPQSKAMIENAEENMKPVYLGLSESGLNYAHSGKVNGVQISSTVLPSPPPSLEFIGHEESQFSLGTEGRIVDGAEAEDLEWEYKLPAPPTGFQDEEEKRDGVVDGAPKQEERETWVADTETASLSTFSSATSQRKMWTMEGDTQPVQHLPNFRMSTYKTASEDGWENPREETSIKNQRKMIEECVDKSKGGRTFVKVNAERESKVEKPFRDSNKGSFETKAPQLSKSLLNKTHFSNLDLSNNSSSMITYFNGCPENGMESNRSGKEGSPVYRVCSFGGKSSMLKRSLSSTSSFIPVQGSVDSRDLEDKAESGTGIGSQYSFKNGIDNSSISNESRTVSLHNLAISSIQEERKTVEAQNNKPRTENTTPKIVSSKWKKPQMANGVSFGNNNGQYDSYNLRKTTSELSISQASSGNRWSEIADDDLPAKFPQWNEMSFSNRNVLDVQLKSHQVLRGVLNQLKNPSNNEIGDKDLQEKTLLTERDEMNVKFEERKLDGAEASKSEQESVTYQTSNKESNAVSSCSPLGTSPEHSPPEIVEEIPKRYSYAGPPAINFGTWNERPKSEVSLKVDNDYRIGVGQAPRLRETYFQAPPNPSVILRQSKSTTTTQLSQTDNAPPCPPPKPINNNNRVVVNIVSATKPEPISKLPIVRSFELKKNVVLNPQSGVRSLDGKFPSDLREELTSALANVADANRNGEAKTVESMNERRKRQQFPCSSAIPPPPPDAVRHNSLPTHGVNLRRMGSSAGGMEGGVVRVNGFMSHEKRLGGVHPLAPVVTGFRTTTINPLPAAQTPAPPAPPPPSQPIVCGVEFKKRPERSLTSKVLEDPRDQMLMAIREFGGREKLKKTGIQYK